MSRWTHFHQMTFPNAAPPTIRVQFAASTTSTKAPCASISLVTPKRHSSPTACACGPVRCVRQSLHTKLVSFVAFLFIRDVTIAFSTRKGLLTHMEHMRMDPKHQFAAQYMLSRAAAERRERDTILAAAVAGGSSLLGMAGSQNSHSRCASPAQSDTSSCNGRLSSAPSEHNGHHNDTNNNQNGPSAGGHNDSNNNNDNNNNSGTHSFGGKLSVNDVLRSQPSANHLHQQFVAAAAAAGIAASNNGNSCITNGLGSPNNPATSAAAAVVNLAAAMRMNPQQNQHGQNQQQSPSLMHHQNQNQMNHHQQHHQNLQNQPDAALRIHQAEAILRSQAEAALRLGNIFKFLN